MRCGLGRKIIGAPGEGGGWTSPGGVWYPYEVPRYHPLSGLAKLPDKSTPGNPYSLETEEAERQRIEKACEAVKGMIEEADKVRRENEQKLATLRAEGFGGATTQKKK